ncbi:Histone H4 [Lamellibrachia satsuma]|nr:Histone H4 [Lamellibrachia satsuma]
MTEGKRPPDEKRYALMSRQSIRAFAESVGITDVSDEVASILQEDVIYRLREVIQNSCQFMRHARRKRLTCSDFNKALRNVDVQPIIGHGSSETCLFQQAKETDLYFLEDADVNLASLASSKIVPTHLGCTTVKAQWLAAEGTHKGTGLPHGVPGRVNGKAVRGVSADLLAYYNNITKAILGTDVQLMKLALTDLRINTKISPLLPYLINFVSNGVKTAIHDIRQLTKLLHTVRAVIGNPSLYLEPQPYLELLLQTVLYCLLEPVSINPLYDDWTHRDYAARLLTQIIRDWDSSLNQLKQQTLSALQEVLYDLARPFSSHYGAILGLTAVGAQAVEDVLLPHLPTYWQHLLAVMEGVSYASAQRKADAFQVKGAIQLAAECIICTRGSHLLRCQDMPPGAATDTARKLPPEAAAGGNRSPPVRETAANPSTSTPMKPGNQPSDQEDPAWSAMQLTDQNDLIGPVITLPENTNPYQVLAELYAELYEYCGDGLAGKLPIHSVMNRDLPRKKEVHVTFEDEHSHKTGEQLLQEFLDMPYPVAMDTTQVGEAKSENQSADGTVEDMDYDVKSERSEPSERSSRSERSHSDESLSFLGDDADLTVKATVSDPSLGIKLTITKRPKIKPPSPDRHKAEQKRREEATRRALRETAATVFDSSFRSRTRARFVFHFQGYEQTYGGGELLEPSIHLSPVSCPTDTFSRLSARLKPYGKRRKWKAGGPLPRCATVHSSIQTVL